MNKKTYIYALKSMQASLMEGQAKGNEVVIDELSERMKSLEGFLRVTTTIKDAKKISVGTIENLWNIAKDDKLNWRDKLFAMFNNLSLVGMSDNDKVDVMRSRLEQRVADYKKEIKQLKAAIDDKSASWNYIKAGVILMLIGLILGIGNNPNMLNSASKKLMSTGRYTVRMLNGENQSNMLARGFSYFYIRVLKFIDENQIFTMCFVAGLFLIGIGIWKRYY